MVLTEYDRSNCRAELYTIPIIHTSVRLFIHKQEPLKALLTLKNVSYFLFFKHTAHNTLDCIQKHKRQFTVYVNLLSVIQYKYLWLHGDRLGVKCDISVLPIATPSAITVYDVNTIIDRVNVICIYHISDCEGIKGF